MALTYSLKNKFDTDLLRIGGNVAELHHQSVLIIYSTRSYRFMYIQSCYIKLQLTPKTYKMICRLFSCGMLRVLLEQNQKFLRTGEASWNKGSSINISLTTHERTAPQWKISNFHEVMIMVFLLTILYIYKWTSSGHYQTHEKWNIFRNSFV